MYNSHTPSHTPCVWSYRDWLQDNILAPLGLIWLFEVLSPFAMWAAVANTYTRLKSGSETFQCSYGGSLLNIVECDIKSGFNRLLVQACEQILEFISLLARGNIGNGNYPHLLSCICGLSTILLYIGRGSFNIINRWLLQPVFGSRTGAACWGRISGVSAAYYEYLYQRSLLVLLGQGYEYNEQEREYEEYEEYEHEQGGTRAHTGAGA